MAAKKIRSATAVTISGTISGWLINAKTVVWPLKRLVRVVARAAMVAVVVAMNEALAAMMNDRMEAS